MRSLTFSYNNPISQSACRDLSMDMKIIKQTTKYWFTKNHMHYLNTAMHIIMDDYFSIKLGLGPETQRAMVETNSVPLHLYCTF